MLPADRVERMIQKYSEEEIDVAREIRDDALPRDRRERAWSRRLLLVSFLTDLIMLKAEIRAREEDAWQNKP